MNFPSSSPLFFLYRSEQPRVEGGEGASERKKCNFLLSKRFGVSARSLGELSPLATVSLELPV